MKEKYFYYSQNFNYPVFLFLSFLDWLFYFLFFNKYIFLKINLVFSIFGFYFLLFFSI